MNSLAAFLHPVKVENKKVVISDRFQENGKPVEWEIRAVSEKENSALERKYTKTDRKTGVQQLDRVTYAHALAAAGVVFPDLSNAELQKAYGVLGETELLSKMLTVGEFAKLSEEVSKLSGLDTNDINEQIEEAKNA
ncbi:phage portal protein [Caproiciproducens galactitolivorans]|uniref:Phage XkdN-like protein n=1 Tax=Caproiciproducens galactitolivorans TaxID=642589 RepID=A0A4Z0YEU1_9FIRM|nr:phage portal protein [Caproiciproducens galactitolivorans]QEY33735.1 phage portal protein [Caproiciproducens galactitolivorans]TGJ75482.1 phage XkdN-like protein [Caproiciproducens galactitolivorans]